jgi:hypothetical protein
MTMELELDSRRERYFSLTRNVHTGSEAHQASYAMGTGGSFPGNEADHSLPHTAEVKTDGAILPLPHTVSWRGDYLIKPRNKFIFYLSYGIPRSILLYLPHEILNRFVVYIIDITCTAISPPLSFVLRFS